MYHIPSQKKLSLSLQAFNILIALWLASFVNYKFYEKLILLNSYNGAKEIIFVLTGLVILTAFYFFFLQFINWRKSAKITSAILIIITGFTSYFVTQLGVRVDSAQVENIVQTDYREALDLFSLPLLIWIVETVVLPLIILLFIDIKPSRSYGRLFLGKIIAAILALAVICGGLFSFYSQFAPIFRENRQLKAEITPLNVFSGGWSYIHKHMKSKDLPLIKYGEDAHQTAQVKTEQPKVMVLIVGETGRAQNFSLNGYSQPTNPELSKLDIVNFTNASSCGTQTSVSVPCMFSGMPRESYDDKLASHREGLLDIAQRAGYEVTWIDNNSGCKETCDRIKNYISIKDDPRYQKQCKDGECLDEGLLLALKDYLATIDLKKSSEKNQLIVLHQMGSHGPAYYKRYPQEFKKFTPTCETNNIQNCDHQALINTYDNTILYTDYIVASAIKMLEKTDLPSSLLYLSDHGESTGENGLYLHGTPYLIAPKEQTHIPMLFWASPQWPDQKQINNCLSKQANDPVGQDNLFPTVLSLLNIQTKVLDPKLDLLDQCKIKS